MIINITGIDGCGKSTQVDMLAGNLQKLGKQIYLSKAFGYQEKAVYSQLLPTLDQISIMFLFQLLHTQQRIEAEKAEKRGSIVITDRWDDSYLAYHENFGILSKKHRLRNQINTLAFNNREADITFLLDIDAQEAERRMQHRGKSFLDNNTIEHFEKLRRGFLKLASRNRRWVVLNGKEEIRSISQQILINIQPLLKRAKQSG